MTSTQPLSIVRGRLPSAQSLIFLPRRLGRRSREPRFSHGSWPTNEGDAIEQKEAEAEAAGAG